ncbi:hypothetical protein ABH930_003356 [Kitasatospora sp. GAS204A]|nr:hypothetical protein [Kitasatospora sp. GAS204B]
MDLHKLLKSDAETLAKEFEGHDPVAFTRLLSERIIDNDGTCATCVRTSPTRPRSARWRASWNSWTPWAPPPSAASSTGWAGRPRPSCGGEWPQAPRTRWPSTTPPPAAPPAPRQCATTWRRSNRSGCPRHALVEELDARPAGKALRGFVEEALESAPPGAAARRVLRRAPGAAPRRCGADDAPSPASQWPQAVAVSRPLVGLTIHQAQTAEHQDPRAPLILTGSDDHRSGTTGYAEALGTVGPEKAGRNRHPGGGSAVQAGPGGQPAPGASRRSSAPISRSLMLA